LADNQHDTRGNCIPSPTDLAGKRLDILANKPIITHTIQNIQIQSWAHVTASTETAIVSWVCRQRSSEVGWQASGEMLELCTRAGLD